MLSTAAIGDLLVKSARAIPGFKLVRTYPLAKVMAIKRFFEELPALRVPACLVVLSDDDQRGSRVERDINWFWVIICKDTDGEAWRKTTEFYEKLRLAHLDRNIAEDVYCEHASRATIIDSPIEFSVATVSFTTRNYGAAA